MKHNGKITDQCNQSECHCVT